MTTRREFLYTGGLAASGALAMRSGLGQQPTLAATSSSPARVELTSFKPGAAWLDTSGKPIQAHGGSVIRVEDVFYRYGENKEGFVPGTGKWHSGVRCYSSSDLYNWTDLGAIIPAVTEDPASPLHPSKKAERPHILLHKETNKFVCWIKIIANGWQTRAVLTADKVTGPYTLVHSGLRPIGMSGGDFDLCVNAADGKAYQYFERIHSELICADLTEGYTNLTGYYSTHFPRPHPPLVREGPAYFFRNGKHYLASSGTTGYHPNPSEIASADTFHGPWTLLGDLHPSDQSRTSFNSQISSVFKHPGKKDLYIALADRWLPHLEEKEGQAFANGDAYRNIVSALGKVFSGQPRTKVDQHSLQSLMIDTVDTSISTYVWLPILFDGDRPVIEWREQWALTDFA